MTIVEKENYLLKVNYSANDIMSLTGCSRAWATHIMKECRTRYNGEVNGRSVITAKSYWLREGTTIEEQLRLLAIAKGYGTTLQERSL